MVSKDGCYRDLAEARHSETSEWCVVYLSLETGELWIRPKDMFEETIEHPTNGQMIPQTQGKNILYRHYKGGMYRKLAEARHSETSEWCIVYLSLETGELWIRPRDMFEETITHPDNGHFVPRFELLQEIPKKRDDE